MEVEQIWQEYSTRLLRFIRSRVDGDMEPEEILQSVFEKILRSSASLKSEDKLTSWLFRITRNAIVDEYRKRNRVDSLPEPEQLADSSDDPAPPEIMKELTACIVPFLHQLEEPYKEAITLVEMEGLTQTELAVRLDLSVSAVKSRVQRGREKLHSMLYHCCRIESNRRGEFVDYEQKESHCSLQCE